MAVQVGAFECLVKIMALYYDKMAFYMEQALFGVCIHQALELAVYIDPLLPVDSHGHEA